MDPSYNVTVAKFNLYPREDPTGFAVGFNISLDNGRSFYLDTVVSLKDAKGKDDEEIVELGWSKLEDNIMSRIQDLGEKSPMLGKEWTPPEREEEENNKEEDE